MTRPICITGMHRSGTSMVARAAQALGLHLGHPDDLVPGAPDNPDGFFEHAGLVTASNALFEQLGAGWDCPPTVTADDLGQPGLAAARELARPVLADLAAHDAWAWKDPRVAPVVPFWLDLVDGLGIVVCLRNPLEVAASLRARNGMSLALGLRLWFQHMDAIVTSTAPRLVTHYDAWFHRPADEVDRLAAFAGITPDAARRAVAQAVPARHQRHARFDAPALRTARVHAGLRDLYERLTAEAAWGDGATEGFVEPITSNGTHPPAPTTENDRAIGQVQPWVVDVGVARYEVHKRNGRVAQLEQRLAASSTPAPTAGDPTRDHAEDLHASVYDLQLSLAELAARMANGIDAETRATDIAYARMIRGVRADVRRLVPLDADVLVISEGEPALLDLHGRAAHHFPVGPSPAAPGSHPASGIEAATHLVTRQALGATHLVVPSTGGWWLAAYPELAERITRSATVLSRAEDGSTILRLGAPAEADRCATLADALTAAQRRLGREPTVLDTTGTGAGGPATFRPPDPSAPLPYLDRTIDVVVVDAGATSDLLRDATRVAAAGVLTGGPDAWTWSWNGPPPCVSADIVLMAAPLPRPGAYLDVLTSTLPAGHRGELTIVTAPAGDGAWRGAADGRATVTSEPLGAALAAVAGRGDAGHVVLVDGSAIPLEGWLPTMLTSFARSERVGLVAGRRRMPSGPPIAALAVAGEQLQPALGAEGDHVTRPIDIAVPGITAWRPAALDGRPLGDDFATLEFAMADHCWGLAADGLECVVQPAAETADLGLPGPGAAARAEDRGRLDRSWGATR